MSYQLMKILAIDPDIMIAEKNRSGAKIHDSEKFHKASPNAGSSGPGLKTGNGI